MSCLFEPYRIGPMSVKNRFVRSATGESRADKEGLVQDTMFPIYEALAAGGVGLIVPGHMYCHADRKCSPLQTGIWDGRHVPGLTRLVEACHGDDTKTVAQINYQARVPAEMTLDDIAEAADCFVAAAQRAMAAGFDGVQIHAAHGYLVSGFLTPSENKRDDAYGGDAHGRRRLLVEIADRTRQAIGANAALLCKLGSVDGRDNSLSIDETVETAQALESAGVDAVEISATFSGDYANAVATEINSVEREAYFSHLANPVKHAVSMPVILVGGLRSLDVMETVVHDGLCDMVSLCRPLIREPGLIDDFQAGRTRRAACISCNKCFNPRGFKCVFVD